MSEKPVPPKTFEEWWKWYSIRIDFDLGDWRKDLEKVALDAWIARYTFTCDHVFDGPFNTCSKCGEWPQTFEMGKKLEKL